jgi:hypothetical protein
LTTQRRTRKAGTASNLFPSSRPKRATLAERKDPGQHRAAKPVPVPNLRIQSFLSPRPKRATLATRKDLAKLRTNETGTGSESPHPINCHPDQSKQRSRSGRTSDSFAPAKPVPVPSLRIQSLSS